MRRLALIQGLLSFAFNTAIIALTINVMSSLFTGLTSWSPTTRFRRIVSPRRLAVDQSNRINDAGVRDFRFLKLGRRRRPGTAHNRP